GRGGVGAKAPTPPGRAESVRFVGLRPACSRRLRGGRRMKGWYNETITSALDKVARRNPAALAIVQGDQRLTYEELLGKAAGIASGLRKLGIAAGEHVGIFYPNDMVVPILHYASACLGTVCVPIN